LNCGNSSTNLHEFTRTPGGPPEAGGIFDRRFADTAKTRRPNYPAGRRAVFILASLVGELHGLVVKVAGADGLLAAPTAMTGKC
jgi:hypothetical protein